MEKVQVSLLTIMLTNILMEYIFTKLLQILELLEEEQLLVLKVKIFSQIINSIKF